MKLDQLLLGQIPEAIYFALFMILVKNIKEKRVLFTILMILEYVVLKLAFPFNMWFQVTYTFMTYIILKILYKEKSQIIDIFTFSIGSIILILISAVLCMTHLTVETERFGTFGKFYKKVKISLDYSVQFCYNMNRNRYVLGAYDIWYEIRSKFVANGMGNISI